MPLNRCKTKWRKDNMADSQSRLAELVKTFERHIETYRSAGYNETQLRREFIDPFFEELGWDVTNKAGNAHAYKDVIHEDAISVGSATKAPDYCFRIGGTRKFFLEAKKPSVNIKDDPHPAYQLRRYAWSAGLPLSILTDFGEFAVYDCLSRPKQTDKASTARIMYLTYNQYLDNWSKIADIFAKEAVLKGSFDKFAASAKGKRGTTTVDVVFLAEIEKWRDMLAKIIALRNRNLSQPEINFAVQCTIDRILFLRMCEDRGIERYGQLHSISSGDRTYPRLCEIFERADQKYNSGLFHFHDEPGRTTPPDTLTPSITIDDKDLKWILYNLYYPQSPYEFSVLPPEILGNVYEQFLGKVITLTPAHHAKIEDKPEVKKAGGVYYTPSYIVDYIVKNTVGKLIDAKTPKQIENIKILDPACGSGSFLLGAYTRLLDYHRDWYVAHDGGKNSKKIYQGRGGHHFLTIAEKKRILLNNIFGVDIDSQAVEVTKLSLLLKVLEGENSQTLENQYRLFHERALPDLASNIKCGNSLIAPDFFDNNVIPSAVEESHKTRHCEEASPEPRRRAQLGDGASKQRNTQYAIRNTNIDLYQKINPFDWKIEFPQIFSRKNPGFDAVIGNPPWGADFPSLQELYLRRHYTSGGGRMLDSYALFIEAGLAGTRKGGLVSLITPDTFLRKPDRIELRHPLLNKTSILELIETGPLFPTVRDTWCLVFLICNQRPPPSQLIRHRKISRFIVSSEQRLSKFGQADWDSDTSIPQISWARGSDGVIGYLASEPQQTVIRLMETQPRLRDLSNRFNISRGEEGSKFTLRETPGSSFAMVIPANVGRYSLEDGVPIDPASLTPSKLADFYQHPKIWAIRIQKLRWKQRLVTCLDSRTHSAGMKTLQVIVSTQDSLPDLAFLQGILSSSLVNFYCVNYLADDMNKTYLEGIPVPKFSPRLVDLVQRMLDLHEKLAAAKVPDEKTKIQRQIDATDRQINHLVYKLYNLTAEEIAIVENSVK